MQYPGNACQQALCVHYDLYEFYNFRSWVQPGNTNWRGRLSTQYYWPPCTSLFCTAICINKTFFNLLAKWANLERRSTVLSLPLPLVFLGEINFLRRQVWRRGDVGLADGPERHGGQWPGDNDNETFFLRHWRKAPKSIFFSLALQTL